MSLNFLRFSRILLSRKIKFREIIAMPHLLYCTIDIRVNERDWKLPFAAGNASYPIPQIF